MENNIIVKYRRIKDKAAPNGQSLADLNCLSIIFPIIWEFVPPKRSGIIKDPRHGMKTNIIPEIIPGDILGMITLKNVFELLAPKS